MSVFGINMGDNKEQFELFRLISDNDTKVIFALGNAGTGKTFITLASALELQEDRKYDDIIYTRNPVQVGKDMGAIPGDGDEKMDPFYAPLKSNIKNIVRVKYRNMNNKRMKGDRALLMQETERLLSRIETLPLAFVRGDTFENTILIVDEAQNLDLTALKAVLTRMGDYCKIILMGSMNQIDDREQRKKAKCDFQVVVEALQDKEYAACVTLTKSMRSKICADIDDTLSQIKN